jgi:hypothetical protein
MGLDGKKSVEQNTTLRLVRKHFGVLLLVTGPVPDR